MVDSVTLVDKAPAARLVVQVGGQAPRQVPLLAELKIGRADDNDLELADPRVSRHHARIVAEGNRHLLIDLGSANGTLVNGMRLDAPHELRHGDQILIGDVELTYQEVGSAPQDQLTAPMVVPSPRDTLPAKANTRGRRGLLVAAVLAATALLLVAGWAAYRFLAPDRLDQAGPLDSTPGAETAPVPALTPTVPGEQQTPSGEPPTVEATAAAVASPVSEEEFAGWLAQAEALTRRGKFEEAVAIYQDLSAQAPTDARPEVGWAWTLLLDDEAGPALSHAQRAVELAPSSAEAATVLARAEIAAGDLVAALAAAEQAVALDPGSAGAQAALAEALWANGQSEPAVQAADLALVQDASNADAHRIRGWLYYLVDGDIGRAAGELQSAAGLQPELWIRRHELGQLLLEANDYGTALLAFQDALALRPKAVTYTGIGEVYFGLGQYDQAGASLQQALLAGAQDADTYALLALIAARRGECDEATSYSAQALALAPSDPRALEAEATCAVAAAPSPAEATGTIPAPAPVSTAKPTAKPKSPGPAPALGGRIVFPVWNKTRGKYDTYIARADGSGRLLVAEQMHQPALSPDGKWLALNGERDEHMNLFVVHPDGSGLKEISRHIEDGLPYWSPDGKSLVFSSTMHGDKQSRVYVLDQVPFEGRQQEGRALNFGPDDVRGEHPAWTADNRIVYKGCDLTVAPAKCGLFSMPASPGAQRFTQLTGRAEDNAPASYDDRIAFMSNRDGNWEIYRMSRDGSDVVRLTNRAAIDGLPTWSPDGKAIAFVSDQGGTWAVWVMGADGSDPRKLFDLGGGGLAYEWQNERISWAP